VHHVNYSVIKPYPGFVIVNNPFNLLAHKGFHCRTSSQNLSASRGPDFLAQNKAAFIAFKQWDGLFSDAVSLAKRIPEFEAATTPVHRASAMITDTIWRRLILTHRPTIKIIKENPSSLVRHTSLVSLTLSPVPWSAAVPRIPLEPTLSVNGPPHMLIDGIPLLKFTHSPGMILSLRLNLKFIFSSSLL
jgi:hypothetical protein